VGIQFTKLFELTAVYTFGDPAGEGAGEHHLLKRSRDRCLSEFRFRRGKGFIMQHRAAVLAITEALMIERTLNSVVTAWPGRARLQSCLQTRAERGRMLSTRFKGDQ
jgi:hypothetical protein